MRVLRIGAAIALLALTAAGLLEFAQWRFNAYLAGSAEQALALNARGETPWQWRFADDASIVAGRVFDAGDFRFDDDGLTVRSDGRAFEIGLPLPTPLDLRRFPQLDIAASTDAPGTLRIVVAPELRTPALYSAPIALDTHSSEYRTMLFELAWVRENEPASLPAHAVMLRLRVELPSGAHLRLTKASAARVPVMQWADPESMVDVARDVKTTTVGIATPSPVLASLDAATELAPQPVLLLTPNVNTNRQRDFLECARMLIPAAIVVPAGSASAVFAQADELETRPAPVARSHYALWIAIAVYLAALIASIRFPPRNSRWRAGLESILVVLAPLWLIGGGYFTGRLDAVQICLIAAVSTYAIALGFPRDWKWNGSARAWLLAAAVVALAAGIGLIGHFSDGGSIRTIGSAHVLRYFGWAMIQQYLVCVVCTSRWKLVTGSNFMTVWLGALGFALLHTPNASLMLATFAGGLCWCALYLRERALLPLAFSHAASALILIALLPPTWLYSAEVSARFFQ